jgi:hypothetical protein
MRPEIRPCRIDDLPAVAEVKEEALARGMDEIEVSTERDNGLARQFYRRQGFDEEYVLLGMELAP